MKRILLSGLLLASVCASAQIIVNESFEGSSLPANFESFGDAVHSFPRNPSFGTWVGTPCDGHKSIYLNLYGGVQSGQWYLVYSSNSSNATDLNYSFKYLAKKYDSSSTVNGTLSVEYSSDGGATWTVTTPNISITSNTTCTTVTGTIPGADIPVGADFKLRIVSKSIGSADYYMGIDEFSIQQEINSVPASCATMVTPTNGQVVNAITPLISYNMVTGATAYKISIGTTVGGTDIIDNEVNNLLTYQVLPSANLQYNTTYYVTVVPTNAFGDVTGCTSVSFNTGEPFNDSCYEAISVTSFPYTNVQANANQSTNNGGFVYCGGQGMNDGLWYKFMGDGSSHTVSISNVQSNFDPELQVYSGSCGAFTCVAQSDIGNAGDNETVTFSTTAGVEYFVNVGHFHVSQDKPEGDFTINITKQLATNEVNGKVQGVTIAPNPFVDVVRFDGADVKSIVATDVTGRKVAELPVEGNVANLGGLTPGMYILMLKHKDGSTSTVKAIKK